jgi:hypothetical protein
LTVFRYVYKIILPRLGERKASSKEFTRMVKRKFRVFAVVLSFIILGVLTKMAWAANVPRISKEELKSMLGNPEVIIIDVRVKGDWDKSKTKIQGAVREDPDRNVKSWAEKYSKDKTLVLYCA